MTTAIDPGSKPTHLQEHRVATMCQAEVEHEARAQLRRGERERTDSLLSEALRGTFPVSDPVAITPIKHASE